LNICHWAGFLPWEERVITAPRSRRAMPTGKQIGLPKDIPCVLAIAGVDRSRIKLPFSSEGPCYWKGVQFFSDYSKQRPLLKPGSNRIPIRISGLEYIRFA
jgi:hypothetical protein